MTEPGGAGHSSRSKLDTAVVLTVLLPLTFVAFRILIFARGDGNRLRALVANLDIKAVVLGSALPLGSTIIAWVALFTLVNRHGARDSTASPGNNQSASSTAALLLVFAAIAIWWAMPLLHMLINAIILIIIVIAGLGLKNANRNRLGQWIRGFGVTVAVAFILVPVLSITALDTWMPRERLHFTGGAVEDAYVLSSDRDWTRYVDLEHDVHIASTHNILEREAVNSSPSAWNKTLAEITGVG